VTERLGADRSAALTALGITDDDVRWYVMLCTRGPATLAELAELAAPAGSARSARSTVARLVTCGLLKREGRSPVRYRAVEPRRILGSRLVAFRERDVAADLASLAELASGAGPAAEPTPDLLVERCSGEFEVLDRLRQIRAVARRRIRALGDPAWWFVEEGPSMQAELLARGLACQVVYPRTTLREELATNRLEALSAAGQESRVLPALPVRVSLVDDGLGILPAAGPDEEPSIVLVHPSTLLDALILLFDNLWQRALPVDLASAAGSSRELTGSAAQTRRILAMMLSGITDETMARRLGISNRTLQRRISELMDSMGVRSRFQLGIQAALRAAKED
jgi:predicted DNA-binding transcriptional regulator